MLTHGALPHRACASQVDWCAARAVRADAALCDSRWRSQHCQQSGKCRLSDDAASTHFLVQRNWRLAWLGAALQHRSSILHPTPILSAPVRLPSRHLLFLQAAPLRCGASLALVKKTKTAEADTPAEVWRTRNSRKMLTRKEHGAYRSIGATHVSTRAHTAKTQSPPQEKKWRLHIAVTTRKEKRARTRSRWSSSSEQTERHLLREGTHAHTHAHACLTRRCPQSRQCGVVTRTTAPSMQNQTHRSHCEAPSRKRRLTGGRKRGGRPSCAACSLSLSPAAA